MKKDKLERLYFIPVALVRYIKYNYNETLRYKNMHAEIIKTYSFRVFVFVYFFVF